MSGQVSSAPEEPPVQASDKSQPDNEVTRVAPIEELLTRPVEEESEKTSSEVVHGDTGGALHGDTGGALHDDTGGALHGDEHQSAELTSASAGKQLQLQPNKCTVEEDNWLDSATDSDDDDGDFDDAEDSIPDGEDEFEDGEGCGRETQPSTSRLLEGDKLSDFPQEHSNAGFTTSAPASLSTSMLDID